MSDTAIKVEHLSKYYKLGVINNGTLFKDIQTWFALKRGKTDPHSKIGEHKYDGTDEGFWALKNLNFEIKQGDRIGIIGKNGAGKSTLLKLLSRITAPTEGCVKIRGRVASLLEVGTGFHGELTGRENVYLNGAILGMKKKEVDHKLDEIIDFSGIEKHIDTPVKRYSSGMYVRLAFAVAAHLDSEILIADEVLAVGDAEFQKKALGKMNELSIGQGRTVLFVSHNIIAVKTLCNKGIILEKGKLVFDGSINSAVEKYTVNNLFESHTKLNVREAERPPKTNLGQDIFINEIEFIGKSNLNFSSQETLKLRLNLIAKKNYDNIKPALQFFLFDMTRIGFCATEQSFSVKKGCKYDVYFDFALSNLAPGRYMIYPQIYHINNLSKELYELDEPGKVFITINDIDKNLYCWQGEYFGNIRFRNPQITKISCFNC